MILSQAVTESQNCRAGRQLRDNFNQFFHFKYEGGEPTGQTAGLTHYHLHWLVTGLSPELEPLNSEQGLYVYLVLFLYNLHQRICFY